MNKRDFPTALAEDLRALAALATSLSERVKAASTKGGQGRPIATGGHEAIEYAGKAAEVDNLTLEKKNRRGRPESVRG
jgi:hypothetical protein